MEFLLGPFAEIILNLLLIGGIVLIRWCIRNKNVTLTIAIIIMMAIDVLVLLKMAGKI